MREGEAFHGQAGQIPRSISLLLSSSISTPSLTRVPWTTQPGADCAMQMPIAIGSAAYAAYAALLAAKSKVDAACVLSSEVVLDGCISLHATVLPMSLSGLVVSYRQIEQASESEGSQAAEDAR